MEHSTPDTSAVQARSVRRPTAAAPLARRALLTRSVGLGLMLPFAVPYARVTAQEDNHHGHGATPTPVSDDDDHGSQEKSAGSPGEGENDGAQAHTETPDPSLPIQPFEVYDPRLPSVAPGAKTFEVVARDATRLVAKDVPCATWTFDGTVPGRPFRVVEGDTVDVTFRVDSAANAHHSLDFHSAQTPPNRDFRTINPGEELRWRFVPRHAGAFMYHCGTPPVLMHIGAGMYGAMIVDPAEGWSPAQELVFVQSDFYLSEGENGVMVPDYTKMLGHGSADFVTFNGYANQYVENPIEIAVGEPVRIFVMNAGPNVWSSFHVVGAIFDKAYVNANPANELIGLQSITIGPGDGACVEFTVDEPGEYVAVNHAFGHAAHGAIAILSAK